MSSAKEQLRERFDTTPGCDDAFIDRCSELCATFNITPENLYFKWESIVMNSTIGGRIITADTPGAIKSLIQSEIARAAVSNRMRVKAEPTSTRKARGGPPAAMLGLGSRVGAMGGVGLIPPKMEEWSTPVKGTEMRTGSSSRRTGAGPSRVDFRSLDEDDRAYKYMYEKISERSEALDDRIDDFADIVRKHYDIADLGDPAASTDDEVTVVGRITLDAEASSSSAVKLNEASLFLESSRSMGSGARVPIRFNADVKTRGGPEGQGGVGLFPGAIVALQGRNGGGGWFSVSTILSLPPLQADHAAGQGSIGPFSMVIACGPYTPDADLSYSPLSALLRNLTIEKPAVLLLLGPFIDNSHPRIKTGEIDTLPEDLFREKFTEPLQEWLDTSPDSLVLLVPNVRDIVSSHVVFPQAQLESALNGGDSRIKFLPNPTRFMLNGVSFAASSVDALFHLRKEELVRRTEEVEAYQVDGRAPATDTMSNLCRHLLQQRSLYPLFPTPLELSHEVNLDVSHMDGLKLCAMSEEMAPDVLIVPSRLKHFSRVVDHTVAINPSYMTKNISAKLEFSGKGEGHLSERIRVDIGKVSES